ncbi:MAG: cobalamin-dependent protein [bacterium]
MITERIQLVFCSHSKGRLSKASEVVPQPPLGILTLAAFLRQTIPHIGIEVVDGKFYTDQQLLQILNADFIGFSCWFSNYDHSIVLADQLKALRPATTIVFGGPHPTAIAERVLANNRFVDYVVRGDGEIPLRDMLLGKPSDGIKGLIYRQGDKLLGLDVDPKSWPRVDLDMLPKLDLDLLQPTYQWKAGPDSPSMSGFPLSGVRGCYRTKRCEYCSIPVMGYRTVSGEKYWAQVKELNRRYGVNYFLETGDTLPSSFLLELAEVKDPPDAWFRFFVYPGLFAERDQAALRKIHVKTVFMGVESVLHWSRHFNRRYQAGYTISTLLHEIERYEESGIDVITGILLGLPGENRQSLADNLELIRRIARSPNVHEMVVNSALPLPGSQYFADCVEDERIVQEYNRLSGCDLRTTDRIDVALLSRIFIDYKTEIKYEPVLAALKQIRDEVGSGVANWGLSEHLE